MTVLDLSAADYHADQTGDDRPSLSASIANILIAKSPAHAKAAHPRLNPDLERQVEDRFDIGTAAHELFLQGDDVIQECRFNDWRTAEARQMKDAAREAGRIPLLPDQAERVHEMVAAAREQLTAHSAQPPLFVEGKPEQTIVWTEPNGVLCRARLDWLRDDRTAIDDLKTTSASADPRKWLRTAYGIGADVQVAFYTRGIERLFGVRPVFRYAVVETYPPFACSVVDLAPSALALAEEKVDRAIELWGECLQRNEWPAYDQRVASLEVPSWAEYDWLERAEAAA